MAACCAQQVNDDHASFHSVTAVDFLIKDNVVRLSSLKLVGVFRIGYAQSGFYVGEGKLTNFGLFRAPIS
jgi:hypothetical protein